MQYNSRKLALSILRDIYFDGAYSNLALNQVFKERQVSKQDRAFITRIVYGTIQNTYYIDFIINTYSKVKTKKMKPFIKTLLRLSIYQLRFMEVPDSAVCNEAVKIMKKSPFKSLSGFVNGVLRSVARGDKKEDLPDYESQWLDHVSIKYSFPTWLIDMWLNQLGEKEEVEKLLEALNEEKGVTIRCNRTRIQPDELLGKIKENGFSVERGNYLPEALVIPKGFNIETLPGYKEGLWTVQDESSMFVAHALSPRENQKVLDVCSAPGGKATHIAEMMQNTGDVLACDIHKHKLALIQENSKRLGLSSIKVDQEDATILDESKIGKYDCVLVDAPCSGLGIITHKPEIKVTKTKEDLVELEGIQRKILETASQYVKVGGTLIYSTCTINKAENQDMVKWFTDAFPFDTSSLSNLLPESLECDTIEDGYVQLLPQKHGMDGFFIARMMRKELNDET